MNHFILWTGGSLILWLICYLVFFRKNMPVWLFIVVMIIYAAIFIVNFTNNPFGGPDGLVAGIEYAGPVIPLIGLAIPAGNKANS